ncbi:MAG: hypothetical protein KAX45_02065 [Chitinophagaceae bacterium]|nr:hypothetical protein [Chitinophagaceae bacterium]MBP6589340.1 hypothetical protein [Chitinophagaceae bacterium]MBP8243300.1 hypothetical protein [Chitinophagaceae bacterium]
MGIGIFAFIIFIVLTVICFIPFAFAAFYLFLGLKSLLRANKESNRQIRSAAIKAILLSLLTLAGSYFLWRWLIKITLSW